MGAAGWGALAQGVSDIGSTVAQAVGAKIQRKWMEKMRSTAYQTMVQDLTSAGLNPALAFGGGNAHLASVPDPGNPMQGVAGKFDVAGAIQHSVSAAQQLRTAKDQAETVAANRSEAQQRAQLFGPLKAAEIDKMDSESARNFETAKLAVAQGTESSARSRHIQEQEYSTRINRLLAETELPGARATQRFDESEMGEVSRQVKRFLEAVPSIRGSSGSSAWDARRGRASHRSWGVD